MRNSKLLMHFRKAWLPGVGASILLLGILSAACSEEPSFDEKSIDVDGMSPSAKVLEYHKFMLSGDFVGQNRLYSNRILARKLDVSKPVDCKEEESECKRSGDYIDGFEVGIAGGQSKILNVVPTAAQDRVRVLTDPPIPLGEQLTYELKLENGRWFIDKVLWRNGDVVKGFEDTGDRTKTATDVPSK